MSTSTQLARALVKRDTDTDNIEWRGGEGAAGYALDLVEAFDALQAEGWQFTPPPKVER